MALPLLLVTGFGAYDRASVNPTAEVARLLEKAPPAGLRVRGRELPVSYRGVLECLRRVAAGSGQERPAALLALGNHRDPWFQLERRARGRHASYDPRRVDNDGHSASALAFDLGDDLENPLDLEALAEVLRAAGAADVRVSDDAGGYVCELTNHALLEEGRRLGVPALFLHCPPVELLGAAQLAPLVGALARALVTAT